MDPVLVAAARALSVFDPLAALRGVALRNDAGALALRGVAMAQLGEFTRARKLLGRAARHFGDRAPIAKARCIAAEAEVALACRDLAAAGRGLEAAATLLDTHGDRENATFVRLQLVRRSILMGELHAAEKSLESLPLKTASPRIVAVAALVEAELSRCSVRSMAARAAIARARGAARSTKIPSLIAEVEHAAAELDAPVARLVTPDGERPVVLADVEGLMHSRELLVDACRREVRAGNVSVSLSSRPVLFAIARALAEAAPNIATREHLIREAFGGKSASESMRARLRVELGRLRRLISDLAGIGATKDGFVVTPRSGSRVHLLLPPEAGEGSALLGLLGDNQSWSTSALSAALGQSQRTVQRALAELLAAGRVHALGRGRARRWVSPPPPGFATTLLLVARGDRE